MISIDNLYIRFGGFDLFKNVSFFINKNDRIGLVGNNGTGKSTLLKVILSIQDPDDGKVNVPADLTFGYLPQEMNCKDSTSLLEETKTTFNEVLSLAKKIKDLTNTINQRTDYESEEYLSLLDSLAYSNERYLVLDGESIEIKTEQTLIGLGLENIP